jgi:predicted metal-dependent phosphoesterase TrpH
MTGKIDLHLHSTVSDGRLTPTALLELAHRNGVRRLSLTDHDTTEGLAEALAAAQRLGLTVIPGIELSCDVAEAEVHMLGLFLEYEHPDFQRLLTQFRAARVGRAERMVDKLCELGVPISWARVQEIAGEATVGRPHVAQALLEAGHVKTMPEAFDRFIGRNGPAYVERFKLAPPEAIELIHSVRGLAVLAHPIESGGEERVIPELASAGLDGVECYYPGYDRPTVERLVGMTREHGMLPTGGSDYHGFPMAGLESATNEPGTVDIPPSVVDDLERRRTQLFA